MFGTVRSLHLQRRRRIVASGHAIIQVDDAGENAILLHGGANQALSDSHIAASLDS